MKGSRVHIVGGGIVGLCAAWYLNQEGCEVTVIDKNDFSNGTSFGNAGMIVPSHFVPMASPGVVGQGLKWMLNRKSPFFIRPRLNAELIQWLWLFFRSSNADHVKTSMPLLYSLNEHSKQLYEDLAAEPGFDFGFEKKGLLMLYKTAQKAHEEAEMAEKALALGMDAQILDLDGLRRLEPEMELDVLGGVYFPGDAHVYPNQLMHQLTTQLREKGVVFIPNTEIDDLQTQGSKIKRIITKSGELIPVENVLFAMGSWTARLLKKVGLKLHIQDGKGYSFTLGNPKLRPRIPTILSEAKVAITPMGHDLRIGGTLELSGLSEKISRQRVQGIVDSLPKYYKNLEVPFSHETTTVWKGYRPCTPDGMPYIGKSETFSNLFVGTGHGMMGLSLGAVTGKLLSQLMTEQEPMLPMAAFRLSRF